MILKKDYRKKDEHRTSDVQRRILNGKDKELGETQRWLKLIQRVPLIKKPELLNDILAETEELIKTPDIVTVESRVVRAQKRKNATLSTQNA